MNLNDLNIKQREAVELIGGPILIFAGAGSGKTRVLTHKIAFLIDEQGLLPENILAVTFTNKAADEMKLRVQHLLKIDITSMNVGTFHSISAKMLRREIQLLGYSNDFSIYDQEDSRALIKKIILEFQLDEKSFIPKSIQAQISHAKNKMISPNMMSASVEGFMDEKISEIYTEYQKTLMQSNALDFDDLLLKPLELFKQHPNRLSYYQNKFKYVLVDEYQDTNRPQFELVKSLSKEHRDICVVGDDDQSIYSWRGADINNILNFTDAFGESKVIKLEQNYRSTKNILECAWSVVSQNLSRAEKKLWTENERGDKITIIECIDERDEGWKVLQNIQKETQDNSYDLDDIVILYRTNMQSRSIEDVLRREGIPYEIIGGIKFYSRKEVKDVLAYLRLIVNLNDNISFDRIINFPPRGIGKTSLEKIHKLAKDNNCSYFDCLRKLEFLSVSEKQKKVLNNFYLLVQKYRNECNNLGAASIAMDLLSDIDLQTYYENQNTHEGLERWGNIKELINSISDFQENKSENSLRQFLEEVSLLTDIDRWNKSEKAVTLMTIHSAKGLEFPIVIIIGLEEGLFPLGPYLYDSVEYEEERRLFYVAMTRSEKKVFLSFANARRRFGGNPVPAIKSRFLNDLPGNLINEKIKENKSFLTLDKSKSNAYKLDYKIGNNVKHKLFGVGKILAIEGSGENAKLTIVFRGNIRKKIIAKYASLVNV